MLRAGKVITRHNSLCAGRATGEISGGMTGMASSADQISAAVSEVNTISGQKRKSPAALP